MLVSEPLAEKALASFDMGRKPSIRRAGWKIIFWEGYDGITQSTVDWGCPQCQLPIHSDVSGIRRCPRCGLSVGEFPVFRENLPSRIRNKEWKEWVVENAACRDRPGIEAVPPRDNPMRSGPATQTRHRRILKHSLGEPK